MNTVSNNNKTTMETVYLSEERYKELQEELKKLKTEGREEVADRLRHAKELGDLSENSEYQEAREEQSRVERKINQLEEMLRHSSIIKQGSGNSGVVKVGSKVKVEKDGAAVLYTIVGSNEANPANGCVSNESPIGRSLLGGKAGDVVSVVTPKGEFSLRVLSVE